MTGSRFTSVLSWRISWVFIMVVELYSVVNGSAGADYENTGLGLNELKNKVCTGEILSGIDGADRKLMIDYLNDERRKFGASNMFEVRWNDDLANMAQGYSDFCEYGHGLLKRCNGDNLGQNAAAGNNLASFDAWKRWYNEINVFDPVTSNCIAGKQCSHFRQMAYSKMKEFGCGRRICDAVKYGEMFYPKENVAVCDFDWYAPGLGTPLYGKGPACSTCVGEGEPEMQTWIKCTAGLCSLTDSCTGSSCQCNRNKLKCNRHGTPTGSDCECECDAHYSGPNCKVFCGDSDPGYCEVMSFMCFDAAVQSECKKTCMQC